MANAVYVIAIDRRRCKGCALCADNCPRKVFTFGSIGDPPSVTSQEECVGCGRCVTLCPDFAITLSRKETHANDE